MISFSQINAQLILILAFALGIGLVSYPSYADARGWPKGNWASGTPGWILVSSFMAAASSLVISFWQIGWIAALITLVVGWILAFILIQIFKSHFQWIGFLMPVLAVCVIGLVRVHN